MGLGHKVAQRIRGAVAGCYECNDVTSRTLWAAAAFGAGAILIAGCGGSGSDFPTGQWTLTTRPGGETTADFRPDGTWELTGPSKEKHVLTQLSSGRYSTTEDTLTFDADSRCEALHYGIEPGTYKWKLEREELTLAPVYEPCVERREDMGGLVFSRSHKYWDAVRRVRLARTPLARAPASSNGIWQTRPISEF